MKIKHESYNFRLSALPDQIKHIIHRELPFFWILIFLVLFALLSFIGLNFMLLKQNDQAFSKYQNIISPPIEQAYITIHLP